MRLVLSAGRASDKVAVPALIDGLSQGGALIADRGYDARAIIDLVEATGGRPHIPTFRDRKGQRSVDPNLYRHRNLIERFFNKLKHFRRIATRYDKTARNFLAAVLLAAIRLWTRTLGRLRSPFAQGWDQMDTVVLGIDVSKDRLDVAVRPTRESFVFDRSAAGIEILSPGSEPYRRVWWPLRLLAASKRWLRRAWLVPACRWWWSIPRRCAPSPRRSANGPRLIQSMRR